MRSRVAADASVHKSSYEALRRHHCCCRRLWAIPRQMAAFARLETLDLSWNPSILADSHGPRRLRAVHGAARALRNEHRWKPRDVHAAADIQRNCTRGDGGTPGNICWWHPGDDCSLDDETAYLTDWLNSTYDTVQAEYLCSTLRLQLKRVVTKAACALVSPLRKCTKVETEQSYFNAAYRFLDRVLRASSAPGRNTRTPIYSTSGFSRHRLMGCATFASPMTA